MKILTFTYTKKDGSVSSRTLLAMDGPSDKYSGIDLSELDANEAQAFINSMQELNDQYLEDMRKLQVAAGLRYNYRQFLAAGMSNIEEI